MEQGIIDKKNSRLAKPLLCYCCLNQLRKRDALKEISQYNAQPFTCVMHLVI